ncbi:Drug resistance transporter EmrB/QacA subfamily [Colletotrichum higginsianum IMI 349063]|uniref:Drug resistance transporter EmrB/QacA subfamily n=2 Tax=Colletotrichum higginsianum (strain IMI 349063) TaxID=759273 RepID=A0A1B7XYI3_COLHI|nr:Drug resistance transporter EmrB/QacA subfamily [Colletotrichum higginsianum IMI 349063]OBR04791.1 Drug resistance transporter EmrB/QacA subfamily [Colletotrichum higginsianum IMI 349063]
MVIFFFPRNARPLQVTRTTFASMDYLGMLLYLTASIMIVFALEEGGLFYPWDGPVVIASFVISGIGFVSFLGWEWVLSKKPWVKNSTLPLFPMHLVRQRIISFSFLTALLAGFPFLVTIVFLPQRFQLINGLSPVEAGVRMLPLLLVSATGAALGGIFSKKYNVSCHVLSASLGLQVLGLGLMTTLPTASRELPPAQYAFQVLLGLGFGLSLSCLVIVAQMEVRNDDDVGITISAITQIRVLGGVIGVAAAQAILNAEINNSLGGVLPPEKLKALQQSATAISSFTSEEAAITIQSYGRGFQLQYKIMIGLSAAALLASLGCLQKKAESFEEVVNRRIRGQGVALD